MNAEEEQPRMGNLAFCQRLTEVLLDVDETCLKSFEVEPLDRVEHCQKREEIMRVDLPGVRLAARVKFAPFRGE